MGLEEYDMRKVTLFFGFLIAIGVLIFFLVGSEEEESVGINNAKNISVREMNKVTENVERGGVENVVEKVENVDDVEVVESEKVEVVESFGDEDFDDFSWESFPINYSVIDCSGVMLTRIQNAILNINFFYRAEGELYHYLKGSEDVQVLFECATFSNEYEEPHLDFAYRRDEDFSVALPIYELRNGVVKRVRIKIFKPGFELHEAFHGLGLVNHYGTEMSTKNYDEYDTLHKFDEDIQIQMNESYGFSV